MPTPDLLSAGFPTLLIGAIVALHWAYWFRHRASDTQQRFGVVDLSGGGAVAWSHDKLPNRTVLEASGTCYGVAGGARQYLHVPIGARAAAGADMIHATWQAPAGIVGRAVISTEDVLVGERSVFLGALKVCGDLVVDGHGIFLAPVVVDGHVRVAGTAEFRCGLLGKSDARIGGRLMVGQPGAPSWLVVQHLDVNGSLVLHGRAIANDGFVANGRAA